MASPLILSLRKRRKFYGSKINILSPAKINLYLNITGRYPGGFHCLESVVERISLCDEITIEVKKNQEVKLCSNFKSLENSENIVLKAIQLLKNKFKLPFGFSVFLKKNIPLGSGLGGGSSNAASALISLNKLLNLNLKREEFYKLGAKLGSDVNFFLADTQFAYLQGRGEKVNSLDIQKKFKHFIIWPGLSISTKEVYERLRVHPFRKIGVTPSKKSSKGVELTRFFNNAKIMQQALRKGDVSAIKKSIFNALEKSAFCVCRELKKAKIFLKRKGISVQVTGSGSAFYTLGNDSPISKIRKIVPGGWVVHKVYTF